jgi:thiol-disulfide isomerase/thioredoxin
MATGRRDALILGGVGLAAAVAGGLAGVLALQSGSGAAELLAARFSDLEGKPRRLLDWQGRALLCNFWATWCAPCREEIPLLVAAKHKLPANGVEIIGIGIDSAANIRQFSSNYRINYPLLVGDATALSVLRSLGNQAGGLPYTVALDRTGTIVQRHVGALTGAQLGQVLASLLG